MYSCFNVLPAYSRAQLFQCVTRVHSLHLCQCVKHLLSCTVISMRYTRTLVVISMCYTHTLGTFISMCYTRTLMYSYFNVLYTYSHVQLFQCVTRVLSCTVISMCYTRTLVCSYFNVLHAYSRVKLLQCVTRVLSCAVILMCYTRSLVVTSMCYTRTFGTVISMCFSSLK